MAGKSSAVGPSARYQSEQITNTYVEGTITILVIKFSAAKDLTMFHVCVMVKGGRIIILC